MYFLMLTYKLNSYQNGMEEKKFDLDLYSYTNYRSQSFYTSPFVYLQNDLVPRRGNQPNF